MIDINMTRSGDVTRLQIHGSLDFDSKPVLDRVQELVDTGTKKIVIDLGGVPHVNSIGLGVLLSSYTLGANHGVEVVLSGMTSKVRPACRDPAAHGRRIRRREHQEDQLILNSLGCPPTLLDKRLLCPVFAAAFPL